MIITDCNFKDVSDFEVKVKFLENLAWDSDLAPDSCENKEKDY